MSLLDKLTNVYAFFVLCIGFALLVLRWKPRAQINCPPTVPGHWFFKNQRLIQNPWRAMLMADELKPLYGTLA